MTDNLKPCPFCGKEPATHANFAICVNDDCEQSDYWTGLEVDAWNNRPIEGALRVQLAARDALIERLVEVGNDIVEEAQLQEPDVQELRDNWRVLIAEWKASKDGGGE